MNNYNRKQSLKYKKRREAILKDVYHLKDISFFKGLSKGKVHCSCPLCQSKTKIHGFKHSDRKRMLEDYE